MNFTRPIAILTINPELQRNLWLELSPGRLIGMPVAIAVLTALAYEIAGKGSIFPLLGAIIWLLLILWGTRLAAETIADEIAGRTWDVQRLSAQHAFSLTMGKFVGGTIYVWYGALICGIAIAVISPENRVQLLDRLLEGLVAQSTAMFVALVLSRFGGRKRIGSLAAQAAGIVIAGYESIVISNVDDGAVAPSFMNSPDNKMTLWFGHQLGIPDIMHGVEFFTVLWMLIAMVRLIRGDLGYRDGPIGLLCFAIFAMLFVHGFSDGAIAQPVWSIRLAAVPFGLTYLALLGLPVSAPATRRFAARVRRHAWYAAWHATAPWMVAALLTVLAVASYADHAPLAIMGVGMLGFLVRDIFVIYGVRSRGSRRPELMLVIYFVVMYAILPFALGGSYLGRNPDASQKLGLACFTPFGVGQPAWYALFPWVEAMIACIVMHKDLRRMYRPVPSL